MAYSATVLAMYPYLAEPDSDGDDDIELGEEDDHVRWDPIQGVHVARRTPLNPTDGNEAEMVPTTAMKHMMTSEPPAGDQIWVEILLEAARALSSDDQIDQNAADYGHIPNALMEKLGIGGNRAYGTVNVS